VISSASNAVVILQTILSEAKQQETDFKFVSTLAQSLTQACSESQAKDMITELRKVKDRLLRVNRTAGDQHRQLKPFIPHVETLEQGIIDITMWINGGEELLASHRIDGDMSKVEERLKEHEVRFEFYIFKYM